MHHEIIINKISSLKLAVKFVLIVVHYQHCYVVLTSCSVPLVGQVVSHGLAFH